MFGPPETYLLDPQQGRLRRWVSGAGVGLGSLVCCACVGGGWVGCVCVGGWVEKRGRRHPPPFFYTYNLTITTTHPCPCPYRVDYTIPALPTDAPPPVVSRRKYEASTVVLSLSGVNICGHACMDGQMTWMDEQGPMTDRPHH